MRTAHSMSSLTIALLAGFGLAACDRTMDGPGGVTGRSCELVAEVQACGADDEGVAYCSPMDDGPELEYGPCLAPEQLECEPGDWKHVDGDTPPAEEGWDDPCAGTDYSCEIVGGVPMWSVVECNTPLVLRFDAGPIELLAAESTPAASFDISMREGSCITTDWPSAATPWLVVDLDHSGSIDGGHELLGAGTRLATGSHAEHGFAALAEFDDDHDGVVDALDARFAELLVWRDWDADRRSTPAELEPLGRTGVLRIDLDYRVATQCDERGNCGVQRAGFEHAGGVGEVVDMYLACQ